MVLTSSGALGSARIELLAISGNFTPGGARGIADADGAACRFDRLAASDCPGLRLIRPSPSLVDAAAAHSRRVIRSGVMSYNAQHMRTAQVFLWKWELLRLGAEYDAILFSDLDVDLLPARQANGGGGALGRATAALMATRIASEWAERVPGLIARRRGGDGGVSGGGGGSVSGGGGGGDGSSGLVMLGYSDITTPLNGGLFWILPPADERLYLDGLAVLRAPWDARFGWEAAGPPAALVGSGRPTHTRTIRQTSWTEIDGGDVDQGFLLYMLYLRHRRGEYMSREGTHAARHYVRGRDGKPSQRTLRYLSSSFIGTPGCGWDNLKRHAFLLGLQEALGDERPPAQSTSPAEAMALAGVENVAQRSPCARRYRRVAHALAAHMPNASACCEALGADAPKGPFGSDLVPVW